MNKIKYISNVYFHNKKVHLVQQTFWFKDFFLFTKIQMLASVYEERMQVHICEVNNITETYRAFRLKYYDNLA